MRILWSSNAIWAHTGYGIQAKYLLPRFIDMGHEVAQFAWYGLQGAKIQAGDIVIYPRAYDPWGSDIVGAYVQDFKADLVISLLDIWVLPDDYAERVKVPWLPWFPVDQSPVPPRVLKLAKTATYPTTYSKFGQEEMRKAGLECRYIPHGVDCKIFRPLDKAQCRAKFGWPADAFVIVMVGANKGMPSRKGFPEALLIFKRFYERHPESLLYLHTLESDVTQGIDFKLLIDSIPDFPKHAIRFVDQFHYHIGLPEEYLADVYNAADVLLHPSYNEGFGLPILEAQACGTPVVVNDNTSMRELCFAGRAVPPLQKFWTPLGGWADIPDIAGFDAALEWIYDITRSKEGRNWLSERARAGAEEYDWDLVVGKYWKPLLTEIEAQLRPTNE